MQISIPSLSCNFEADVALFREDVEMTLTQGRD